MFDVGVIRGPQDVSVMSEKAQNEGMSNGGQRVTSRAKKVITTKVTMARKDG